MNDRVHRALDGDLAREDLTPSERATAAAFDAAVDALRSGLNESVPADLDVLVMGRIRDLGLEPLPAPQTSLPARLARTLWAPREFSVRLRPAWSLLAAAAIAGLMLLRPFVQPAPAVVGSGADEAILVQFRLDVGTATQVALAGSFSGWQPSHVMQQTGPGVWTTVLSVPPGVHDYVFVVDGREFVPDPTAPQVADGFGGVNSRLTVLPPTRGL